MAGGVPSCLKLDHNQTKIKLPLPTASGLQEEAVGAGGREALRRTDGHAILGSQRSIGFS